MTIQTLLQTAKKNWLLALSGGIVLVCLVVHFVRSEQITRLVADYDDLSIRRSRMLKNFRYATNIENDLESARQMNAEVEARLFNPEDLASNQRYFYQVENSSGVVISNLQQIIKPAPTGKKSKLAQKKAATAKYKGIVYDMSVAGSYEEIIVFLRQIEGGRAFATLDGFSLSQDRADDGSSKMTMRVSVEVLARKG